MSRHYHRRCILRPVKLYALPLFLLLTLAAIVGEAHANTFGGPCASSGAYGLSSGNTTYTDEGLAYQACRADAARGLIAVNSGYWGGYGYIGEYGPHVCGKYSTTAYMLRGSGGTTTYYDDRPTGGTCAALGSGGPVGNSWKGGSYIFPANATCSTRPDLFGSGSGLGANTNYCDLGCTVTCSICIGGPPSCPSINVCSPTGATCSESDPNTPPLPPLSPDPDPDPDPDPTDPPPTDPPPTPPTDPGDPNTPPPTAPPPTTPPPTEAPREQVGEGQQIDYSDHLNAIHQAIETLRQLQAGDPNNSAGIIAAVNAVRAAVYAASQSEMAAIAHQTGAITDALRALNDAPGGLQQSDLDAALAAQTAALSASLKAIEDKLPADALTNASVQAMADAQTQALETALKSIEDKLPSDALTNADIERVSNDHKTALESALKAIEDKLPADALTNASVQAMADAQTTALTTAINAVRTAVEGLCVGEDCTVGGEPGPGTGEPGTGEPGEGTDVGPVVDAVEGLRQDLADRAGARQASGGAACGAPPPCAGDPLDCALLAEQHAARCEAHTFREALAEGGSADPFGPDEVDGDPSDGWLPVGHVSVVLDEMGFGFSRSCPSVELLGRELMGPAVCDALSAIGAMLLAFAYFAGLRVVLSGGVD